jgi:hypothetical protein
MGKQPGRHSGRFCKGRGLSTAAGTFDKNRADVLTLATDTAAAVNSVTRRYREAGSLLQGRSAKLSICLCSQLSLAATVMEMKLHGLRGLRSDYGLLKQYE